MTIRLRSQIAIPLSSSICSITLLGACRPPRPPIQEMATRGRARQGITSALIMLRCQPTSPRLFKLLGVSRFPFRGSTMTTEQLWCSGPSPDQPESSATIATTSLTVKPQLSRPTSLACHPWHGAKAWMFMQVAWYDSIRVFLNAALTRQLPCLGSLMLTSKLSRLFKEEGAQA